MMDTTTKIVLNESELVNRLWSLENKLSIASKYKNTYIVSVFDCCREVIPVNEIRANETDDIDYDGY